MRKYESVIVFSPELSEAQAKQELSKFEAVLQGKGVKDIKTDHWGRKDLAYIVRKHKTGKFVCLNYHADDYSCVEALTALLRISDSVIKFQSHRINEKVRKFRGNPQRAARGDAFEEDFTDSIEADF